jgi:hypothetical protein
MTPEDYRKLYQLLRQYQLEQRPGGKLYDSMDRVLSSLFHYYYNQRPEQER